MLKAKAKQKQVLTLEQGALKASSSQDLESADVGTELKLMFAFQRRGLAFDLVSLTSWEVHVEWTNKLYRALISEPAPGCNHITMSQILRADRELFMILASESNGNLKPASTTLSPPLDEKIQALMTDPRINVHLTMVPRVDKRPSNEPDSSKPQKKPSAKAVPVDRSKATSQLPDSLKGLNLKTKDNKPLCWRYNLQKGCNNEVKKSRCRFGFHYCMRCLKQGHGAASCPNN